jgi:hypothetical protein
MAFQIFFSLRPVTDFPSSKSMQIPVLFLTLMTVMTLFYKHLILKSKHKIFLEELYLVY